jgi:hypothetical protein
LTALRRETCSNEQHHHRLVFEPFSYTIPARGLPWKGDTYLNLALSAHHPDAGDDQVVLIGQNEPPPRKGQPAFVKGDQGKLNVVRYRGMPKPRGRVLTSRRPLASEVPIVKGQPATVYSLALPELKRDEQLTLQATYEVRNPHGYPARVSTSVVLSDSPTATELPKGLRGAIPFHGEIGKSNGSNCLPNQTYLTEKFGTLRVLDDIAKDLYANLVISTGDPEHRAGSGDSIFLEPGGFVAIRRFSPRAVD